MSATIAFGAFAFSLACYFLSRREAEWHKERGNQLAVKFYLRAAFQLGAACAFGAVTIWVLVTA